MNTSNSQTKIIDIPHKYCENACMVNGLEDLYVWKSGHDIPDYLLYYTGGMVGFTYVKNKKEAIPNTVYWGNGLGKKMYAFLSDIVGYTWKMKEGGSFKNALRNVKRCIDNDVPVVFGKVDIFYLPYYQKYYHKHHIPAHFVLAVGYSDVEEKIYVNDCGREKMQSIPYSELELAWKVKIKGICKEYRYFTFQFSDEIASPKMILKSGLKKKAEFNLNPPVSLFGLKAMQRFANDFTSWKKEMPEEQFQKCLLHLIEFAGSYVPVLPTQLSQIPLKEEMNVHKGGRDRFAIFLRESGAKYDLPQLNGASLLFTVSGELIQDMVDILVDFLMKRKTNLLQIPDIMNEVINIEAKAFQLLKQ
nr:BtrH N-terminal domain-containing protein [uncultured Draconibacterium sp.]